MKCFFQDISQTYLNKNIPNQFAHFIENELIQYKRQ
jgi:hypothetical protein